MSHPGLRVLLGLLALCPVEAGAQSSRGLSASLNLKIVYGGALLQGRVSAPKADELIGLWSSMGRARLLKCAPRCRVVGSVPVVGTLILGSDTGYRVVLGGNATAGQKVTVVLRLRGGSVLNVTAPVTH